MNIKTIMGIVLASVGTCGVSLPAMASDDTTVVLEPGTVVESPTPVLTNEGVYHPDTQTRYVPSDRRFRIGVGFDIGSDGAALGAVVSPFIPAFRVEGAFTYNYLSEGLRGSVSWDVFNFGISPLVRLDFGGYFPASIPGVNNSPRISYTYEDFLVGFAAGKRTGFRFFVLAGAMHIDANAEGFNGVFTLPASATVGDPHIDGWAPSVKVGGDWLF